MIGTFRSFGRYFIVEFSALVDAKKGYFSAPSASTLVPLSN